MVHNGNLNHRLQPAVVKIPVDLVRHLAAGVGQHAVGPVGKPPHLHLHQNKVFPVQMDLQVQDGELCVQRLGILHGVEDLHPGDFRAGNAQKGAEQLRQGFGVPREHHVKQQVVPQGDKLGFRICHDQKTSFRRRGFVRYCAKGTVLRQCQKNRFLDTMRVSKELFCALHKLAVRQARLLRGGVGCQNAAPDQFRKCHNLPLLDTLPVALAAALPVALAAALQAALAVALQAAFPRASPDALL